MRLNAASHPTANPVASFAASMAAHGLTPPADLIADGKIHRFATNDKRSDDAGGYVLHLDGVPAGAFWDHRSGLYVTWSDRKADAMTDAERSAFAAHLAQQKATASQQRTDAQAYNAERNAGLWRQTLPVTEDDPVARYLRSRRLDVVPPTLRYHPSLAYWECEPGGKPVKVGEFPAMLAQVQQEGPGVDPVTVALHRTYLTAEGHKAPVNSPKKLTATSGDMRGAAIRLSPVAMVDGGWRLGVAEGIETALATTVCSRVPTWAAVSATGLKHFQWPRHPHELYIFGDNDRNGVGQEAAKALHKRAHSHGVVAHVILPPDPGTDWADVWKWRL